MQLEVLTYTPEHVTHRLPLLFVHGAWHGAWCWEEYFLPFFSHQGYVCYALSLRGHGGSEGRAQIHRHGISGYVEDVARVAANIRLETGQHPVIIGHSMGGCVAQKYLERYDAPGAALLATIPVYGFLPAFLRKAAKHPAMAFRTLTRFSPWEMIRTPELARREFFSPDMSMAQVRAYHAKMQQESMRVVFDVTLLNLPRPARIKKAVPVLVLAAGNDALFSVDESRTTARAYNAKLSVMDNMAHDVMLESNWQQAADVLLDWLQTLES